MRHTATFATDGIVTGQEYSFRFRAVNSKGSSDYSEILSVAAIDPPEKAFAPQVDYTQSSRTSLFVKWQINADQLGLGELFSGYKLYMDDGYGGDFKVVLDTVGLSNKITHFLATGLTPSLIYRFKVAAFNKNGVAGQLSDISSFMACDVPKLFAKPNKLSTTRSSITVNWSEPADNGGCSIQGYSVHIDDGNQGPFVEANVENDINVRLQPSLSQLTITRIAAANLGKTYQIKVRAYNPAGVTESKILGVVFAALPDAPPVPRKVLEFSSSTSITVDISDFPQISNGGCEVITFDI